MAVHIGRREFITLLGGGTGAWPIVAWAQQPAMPVIGYLYGGTSRGSTYLVDAFRKGLSEMGYLEGKNVTIEYRFTEGDSDRIPELAADLVRPPSGSHRHTAQHASYTRG